MWCIYEVQFPKGQTYIGQHKYYADPYEDDYIKYGGSGKLCRDWRKNHNVSELKTKILYESIQTQKEADQLEIKTIKEYKQNNKAEFNIAEGGNSGNRIAHYTEEQMIEYRKKLSKGVKNYIEKTPDYHKKRSLLTSGTNNGMYNKHRTENEKEKISKQLKETYKDINKRPIGKKNGMYGKHHTPEQKEKQRQKMLGKKLNLTEKGKQHLSEIGLKNRKYLQQVKQIETNIFFENIYDVEKKLHLNRKLIRIACQTGNLTYGYHWQWI
jgi:hypothetical protein